MGQWKKRLRRVGRRLNRAALKSSSFSRRTAPGAMPGSVVADPRAPRPRMRVISYDAAGFDEHDVGAVTELGTMLNQRRVTWIDVTGLGDASTLEAIGKLFSLHRLELEDIVNTHQRAKVEDYGDHLYIVMREAVFACPLIADQNAEGGTEDGHLRTAVLSDAKLNAGEGGGGAGGNSRDRSKVWVFDTDQVSICVGPTWLITFQEKYGDCFGHVRERIRKQKGKLTTSGTDALAYAIIDAIVDSYFPVLELYGERLEHVEEETTERPTTRTAQTIHEVKRDLLTMRRAIWPAREAVNALIREDHALVSGETRLYLRDCYDHLIQLLDMLETYREIGSGLMDIYLASVSHRMNEIMKVLTIIATIFMPLSFVAGVYGMNFSREAGELNMPELHWKYGYFFALAVMGLTAAGLVWYFWRKGWIWGNGSER